MGMGFLKLRAAGFKQRIDEALANDIKQPTLSSNLGVACHHTYECVIDSPGAFIEVGGAVRLVDMRDRIDVFVGMEQVGQVLGSQSEFLRAQLSLSEREGRSVGGHTVEVSQLTPTFTVRVGE